MYARFLRVVPLVRSLKICQHLDGPGQDTDQEEGDQQSNPDGERDQGLAVPVGTEPETQ